MMASTISIEVASTDIVALTGGQFIVVDFDWSGNSVCGRGPDDEVPDINDVRAWIESGPARFIGDKTFVRDLTADEIERLTVDTGPVAQAMYEAIHEACQEPYYDEP